MSNRTLTALLALAATSTLTLPGRARAGTLDQIKKTGEIRLAYRTDSLPLAFNEPSGEPSG
jgi:ABC-type amino acid transport substrate-binding protein